MNRSETKSATIFIQGATLLDCAIALPNAFPQGFSWQVDSTWQGEPDSSGILVDFSLAKRMIRETIDRDFDHRLFVASEQTMTLEEGSSNLLVKTPWQHSNQRGHLFLKCPREALAILDSDCLHNTPQGLKALEHHLAEAIKANAPKNVKTVRVKLRNTQERSGNFFRYIHALPFHLGNCQRFHGHSSTVEIIRNGQIDPLLSEKIAKELDGRFCLASKFLTNNPEEEAYSHIKRELRSLGYSITDFAFARFSGTQGEVALALPRWAMLELPQESTIENMAEFVRKSLLPQEEGVQVIVYEGLQKGAMSS